MKRITDTERLDFLLNYFVISDVGDEDWVLGTCVLADELETVLQTGVHTTLHTDLRDIIDRAIVYQQGLKDKEMETWMDVKNKLEWQVEHPLDPMNWYHAIAYANTLGDGWRLPTVHELVSLIDYGLVGNVTAKHLPFQNIASYYWSSTTHASHASHASYASYAWRVHFYNGNVYNHNKTSSYYVRCVRDAA